MNLLIVTKTASGDCVTECDHLLRLPERLSLHMEKHPGNVGRARVFMVQELSPGDLDAVIRLGDRG